MATDFLSALRELVEATPDLIGQIPGGWHLDEGAIVEEYPYAVAKLPKSPLRLETSTSKVDDATLKVRIYAPTTGPAMDAAKTFTAIL
ncbi:hypothetical protein ACYOEI_38095, partial [Singulisphaera rosea]